MNIPPLCIITARLHSTRLPGKMLMKLSGETLIARAWRIACETFGEANCVVAIPKSDEEGELGAELLRSDASIYAHPGDENDVLCRLYAAAHSLRWHPYSVIVRYTPEDPFKNPMMLRRVAGGERLPVELGGEAFTLKMLDRAQHATPMGVSSREHVTHALFPFSLPSVGERGFTVDTYDDYKAARLIVEGD